MSLVVRTNDEWTIHSINIQGTFFERACRRIIANTQGWQVISTNYPVEFPPPNGPWRGTESKLDIRAEYQSQENKITLLIECKKHNPELIDWIFFPAHDNSKQPPLPNINFINNTPLPLPSTSWNITGSIGTFQGNFIVTDDAWKTSGSYLEYAQQRDQEKVKRTITKTSNAAIESAAYQVALATQSIINEEHINGTALKNHAQSPGNSQILPYLRQALLPMIVTTAKLFVCTFKTADIEVVSGELPLDKAQFVEYASLLYRYALPRSLQNSPESLADALKNGIIEKFRRMDILIVTSTELANVLAQLTSLAM